MYMTIDLHQHIHRSSIGMYCMCGHVKLFVYIHVLLSRCLTLTDIPCTCVAIAANESCPCISITFFSGD